MIPFNSVEILHISFVVLKILNFLLRKQCRKIHRSIVDFRIPDGNGNPILSFREVLFGWTLDTQNKKEHRQYIYFLRFVYFFCEIVLSDVSKVSFTGVYQDVPDGDSVWNNNEIGIFSPETFSSLCGGRFHTMYRFICPQYLLLFCHCNLRFSPAKIEFSFLQSDAVARCTSLANFPVWTHGGPATLPTRPTRQFQDQGKHHIILPRDSTFIAYTAHTVFFAWFTCCLHYFFS